MTNGYTNRATWIIIVHLSNDKGSYELWRNIARESAKRATAHIADIGPKHLDVRRRLALGMVAEDLEEAFVQALNNVAEIGEGDPLTIELAVAAARGAAWREIADAFVPEEWNP